MNRSAHLLLTVTAILAAPVPASGQVDLDAIRSGAAGCPELAADPDVGNLAAFLCRPAERTILDSPINLTENKFWEVRAGSFSPLTRPALTGAARPSLGDEEFERLQRLLIDGQVLSHSRDARRIALLADALDAEAAGNPGLAAALRAEAAAILGTPETSFDANIPALLATRADRDRLADLRSGLLRSPGARDTVSHHELVLGETIRATIGGLPFAYDSDGYFIYSEDSSKARANPYFVGPDGIRDTADDLPYVATNARAQAAGYSLADPISDTVEDRFDASFGDTVQRPIFAATAQILVESVGYPTLAKLVELYGVYDSTFLASLGCAPLGGSFDSVTGTCTLAGGDDIGAAASQRGCLERAKQLVMINIGTNADGDCIELNMSAQPSGSQLQFEVIALLGDVAARPLQATVEPVDLTDFRAVVVDGPNNTLPARPRSDASGNISFPVQPTPFRRSADLVSGAPLTPSGSQCRIRTNLDGDAIGPNGFAGDADDVFPSAGQCLLWNPPESPAAPQQLRSSGSVATLHSVNQSLFHLLCTLSFDSDAGHCKLDRLNSPVDFGLISNFIAGIGYQAAVVLEGFDTIQSTHADGSTSVTQRVPPGVVVLQTLAVEPLASQSQDFQDLGMSLQAGQAALLGCGPAYASSCSKLRQILWRSDPSIAATLTRDPELGPSALGGIDLMNAVGSVITQEFATLKLLRSSALVATTSDGSGQLVYLPGVNFSRTGQAGLDLDQNFSRQGVQRPAPALLANAVEPGSYLPLTPTEVVELGVVGRAQLQTQAGNLLEADGWIEGMPWTVNQDLLDTFGAIVFNTDPNNVLDLDSPLNQWNTIDGNGSAAYSNIDGEYCGRWMSPSESRVATPFNLGCTALETFSANLERWNIATEVVGQDRVFDPPESLQELVAMLDGDPSNDGSGDPIAGPDGIFARNQYVLRDDEADFEVISAFPQDDSSFVTVPLDPGEDPKSAAEAFLGAYEPQESCLSDWCYLEVNNVLIDPDDAKPQGRSLVLAMPIGFSVDVVSAADPNDPDSPLVDTGFDRKVNLAKLHYFELPTLRRLLARQAVAIETELGTAYVRMNRAQSFALLGEFGSQVNRGRDLDIDASADLDRNRDAIWDGQDDFLPGGPTSDDGVLCGSGIPGDRLQDGEQYRPYRADEAVGSAAFNAVFPDGLPPRSPVFCRGLNALLALIGPVPGAVASASDAFLWHGGAGAPGTDDDADGFPDVLDSCPTIANASQADGDGDGVGDVCDNCTVFPNPRVAEEFLTAEPWATLTGGQRDDDHDGFGNLCDADFTPTGVAVGPADLAEFRASSAQRREVDLCGSSGDRACAIFDLDERNEFIDPDDLARHRELNARRPGPKCAACPLVCETGEPEGCD